MSILEISLIGLTICYLFLMTQFTIQNSRRIRRVEDHSERLITLLGKFFTHFEKWVNGNIKEDK